jgi:hypothetical protein
MRSAASVSPIVLSASRATDIPAFYGQWFLQRLHEGFVDWTNPFNRHVQRVLLDQVRAIVFWTKNPEPMIPLLERLDELKYYYYFNFTLNDYESEDLEIGLPELAGRIDTFIRLSDRLGKERVVWRADPIILGGALTPELVLQRIGKVGNLLAPYTDKLVFSFVDIQRYRKVSRRLARRETQSFREPTPAEMNEIAVGLSELNKEWGLELATCAENIDLSQYGIAHNSCVDDVLLGGIFPLQQGLFVTEQSEMMKKTAKDKGQRKACRCLPSKDIGGYGTCRYRCRYCYAQ